MYGIEELLGQIPRWQLRLEYPGGPVLKFSSRERAEEVMQRLNEGQGRFNSCQRRVAQLPIA